MRAPLLAVLLSACATAQAPSPDDAPLPPAPPLDPSVKVAIVQTTPAAGSTIDRSSVVRVVVDYSLANVQSGKDRVAISFRTEGGITQEGHYVLTRAQGRVTFELQGHLLLRSRLRNPTEAQVVIDRWLGPYARVKLAESQTVSFVVDTKQAAKFLPPSVGIGLLISDLANDPVYKPRLPPELNVPGMVVWGLFKLCVDQEGRVYAVDVLKSADRRVDADWLAVMQRLQHRPYLIDGKPVDYCYPLRLEVRSQP